VPQGVKLRQGSQKRNTLESYSEGAQIRTEDLVDVPKDKSEEKTDERSAVEVPNLSAGIEVLDVVQGTGDGSDDGESVNGLKEDGIFDEEIDADGEAGVERESNSQRQIRPPRRLAVLEQSIDEEAGPEYHRQLVCNLHSIAESHVEKPRADADQ